MKKISVILLACSMGLAVQAQIIDPLTGSLSGYTTTLILDNSGGASSVSFTDSASGLQANYVGTVAGAEQAVSLAPVSSFSTAFAVGKRLTVNVAVPVSTIQEDLGLAIAATATPPAAGAGLSTRANFDWASVGVRPSQTSIRANSSISGTLVTANGIISGVTPTTVSQLFIDWDSADLFTMGYIDSSAVQHVSEVISFAGTSTIGTAIGFYGDIRDAGGGTTLGALSNLAISTIPVPEPTTMALCGLGGLLGLAGWMRRKQ